MNINKITSREIEELSPTQLTRLLLMLVHLEVTKHNLVGFHYISQKINVADGGEDGRVELTSNGNSNWLKANLTIFQCKAMNLTPGKCKKELLEEKEDKSGMQLKPIIKDVLDNGGKYVLFMSHAIGKPKGLADRIDKFIEATTDVGLVYPASQFIVYDGQKISEWVNEYISTLTFVLECNGKTRDEGFRTWNQWQSDYSESLIFPFEKDFLNDKITFIKDTIRKSNCLRVIGHSGIGKTRLVFEALAPELNNEDQNRINFSVVYYDLGLIRNTDDLVKFILNFKDSMSAVLVIDNCSEDFHRIISGLVRTNSKIKIITIDYSIQTEERNFIFISKIEQRNTVFEMLKKVYKSFSETDIERLSNLAEGYPRMVELIINAMQIGKDLFLNPNLPRDFVEKLVFGRDQKNDVEYEVIRSCAIFTEFNFLDEEYESIIDSAVAQKLKEHAEFISSEICSPTISYRDFDRICKKFKRDRKIMERRGLYYSVVPTPLAAHLAANWLLDYPFPDFAELSHKLTNKGLIDSFCKRLKSLDQIERAKTLVAKLWGPEGPFSSVEVLNTELGSRLFHSVVDVNPEETLEALEKFINQFSIDKLKTEFVAGRRYIVWSLEKLVFRKNLFDRSAKLMCLLAVAENENISNNATGQLIHLFQPFLAGTEADFEERIKIIDWCLENKSNKEFLKLSIQAMGRALTAHHHTRMLGAERQGFSTILKDYKPKDWPEIFDYWNEVIERLVMIATSKDEFSPLAQSRIASSIRLLFSFDLANIICTAVVKIKYHVDGIWQEALQELRFTLQFEKLNEKNRQIVQELIDVLQPTDFLSRIKLLVSVPPWESRKVPEGERFDIAERKAEEFAEEIVKNNYPIADQIAILLEGEQRQAFVFGNKLGQTASNVGYLIEISLKELKLVPIERRNLSFIVGLLYSREKEFASKIIDQIISDDELARHAVNIARAIKPNKKIIFSLFELVDKGVIEISEFSNFIYGRPFDEINTDDVLKFCEKVASYGQDGAWTAFQVINQYMYNNEKLWEKCKGFIRELIVNLDYPPQHTNTNMDYFHWSNVVDKFLDEANDKELAEFVSKKLAIALGNDKHFSIDLYFKNVAPKLISKFFNVFWENVSPSIISDSIDYLNFKSTFGAQNGNMASEGYLFIYGNYDIIFEWMKANSPKAPKRVAYFMPILAKPQDGDGWHPFALRMFKEFGHIDGLMNEVGANMGSYGMMGSVVPYLEQMKKMIEQLLVNQNEKVKAWADKMVKAYEKEIKREKLNDEQFNIK